MKNKLFFIGLIIGLILLSACSTSKNKYDEVIYDCGSRLVKGTQVPNSEWTLENGIEEYYLYADEYTIKYNWTPEYRKWEEHAVAVGLYVGEGNCTEMLRLYNYTEYNPTQLDLRRKI